MKISYMREVEKPIVINENLCPPAVLGCINPDF